MEETPDFSYFDLIVFDAYAKHTLNSETRGRKEVISKLPNDYTLVHFCRKMNIRVCKFKKNIQ
jgi:hypothetical protein